MWQCLRDEQMCRKYLYPNCQGDSYPATLDNTDKLKEKKIRKTHDD